MEKSMESLYSFKVITKRISISIKENFGENKTPKPHCLKKLFHFCIILQTLSIFT
jgi:hypothetical protein